MLTAVKTKKRKIETLSSLWNEDILYEIVSFIKSVKDFIHFAQTCRNIYNCLLENEICLNLIFKNYYFIQLPKEFPNYFYKLKHLHFFEGNLTIEQLQKFTKIESLTLPDQFEITNLFLENCNNLKLLKISNNSNKNNKYLNFEVLKDNLEDLNIKSTKILDEQIDCLENLTNLNISNCKNISGECLLNFTKLKKLKANQVKVNTEYLKNLNNLEYLKLSFKYPHNEELRISTLQNLKNLKILKLKEIIIYDSQYFEKLNLIELDFNESFIDENDALQLKLPNSLQKLNVYGLLDITDEQLNNLTNLTDLDVAGCYQLQCTFLENMKNLETLMASSTLISDKELLHCKKLQHLNINCCLNVNGTALLNLENLLSLEGSHLIKDEHLKNLKKVYHLFFNGNNYITDEIFLNLLNLKQITLINCEKIKGSNLKYLKKLKYIYFVKIDVMDENLQDLNNLKVLRIENCPNFTGKCLQYLNNLKMFRYQSEVIDPEEFSGNELKELIEKLKSKSIIEVMEETNNVFD